MCYLIRQQAFEAEPGGVASPPRPDGLRQRWVGAAALTLIAGVAIAAAVVPRAVYDTIGVRPEAMSSCSSRQNVFVHGR